MKKQLLLSIYLLIAANTFATIINVPGNQTSIQDAINSSSNADTIIVQPGVYFENLNFNGHTVFLTSLFYLNHDTTFIQNTIINGSQPVNADFSSCAMFVSGEDSTAVLQGFTLTGGQGTVWTDIHGAGTYREGAGIFIEVSSPTIQFNRIIYNMATQTGAGISSAGGGGIRIGDAHPKILNNIIAFNSGKYGAGVVLNYTGVFMANNLIAFNSGGEDFGGAGIWAYNNLNGFSKTIQNNTIVNNHSLLNAGGLYVGATTVIFKNNIVWNNTAVNTSTNQIAGGTSVLASYNDIQGGFSGNGNINIDPDFADESHFWLDSVSSPCIDAGDSSLIYNDVENLSFPANALFPSLGNLRNDMGAYGGNGVMLMPGISGTITSVKTNEIKNKIAFYPNPVKDILYLKTVNINEKNFRVIILDPKGKKLRTLFINNTSQLNQIDLTGLQDGLYIIKTEGNNFNETTKIIKSGN